MKNRLLLSVLLISIVLCNNANCADFNLSEKIIGTWILDNTFVFKNKIVRIHTETTILKDHKLKVHSQTFVGEQKISVQFEADWEIKENTIKSTVIKSSNQKIIPVGLVIEDIIIRITNEIMEYSEEGKNWTAYKKNKN